jgi:hypothetical protein
MRRIEPQMCNCTSGNLEIPGLVLTHNPGMTECGLLRRYAPRNDGSAIVMAGLVPAIHAFSHRADGAPLKNPPSLGFNLLTNKRVQPLARGQVHVDA